MIRGRRDRGVVPDGGVLGFRLVALDRRRSVTLSVAPGRAARAVRDRRRPALPRRVRLRAGVPHVGGGLRRDDRQNTVRKQSRIVQSCSPPCRAALLAGKIATARSFGQTAALAAMAVLGLMLTGQDECSRRWARRWWFVGFFLVGFVLLAAIAEERVWCPGSRTSTPC